MAGTLKPYPGISSGSVKDIPQQWDPAWYRRQISNFQTYADARNAQGANGITISGNLTSVATIGGSALTPVTVVASSYVQAPNLYLGSLTNVGINEAYNYSAISSSFGSLSYMYIGTLPASSGGTADYMVIEGVINLSWGAVYTAAFELHLGNRNGFSARLLWKSGSPPPAYAANATIACFSQVDGTTQVWLAVAAGQFAYWYWNTTCAAQVILPRQDQLVWTTTAPSGTIVYDMTTVLANYSPFQNVSWQTPTLGINIANLGAGWTGAGYALDPTGRVSLRGLIAGAGLTVGSALFTLPVGYRPAGNETFVQSGQSAGGLGVYRIDVDSTGVVLLEGFIAGGGGNPTTYLSLGGINFMAGY